MITRIVSNVKTGCDVKLGAKTLIVGPNGAGKSAIVNALELALTGRASDVAGRADVGSQGDLWALAPPGAEEITATASFATAPPATFSMKEGKRPVHGGPMVALPLREVREALLSSGEGGRKWLLSKAGGETSWRGKITGNAERLASLPDSVADAVEAARSKARDARARASVHRDAVRATGSRVPVDGLVLAEAERRVLEATAERDRCLGKAGSAAVSPLPALVAQLQDAHLASNGSRCAVCGSLVPLASVKDRRAAVQKVIDRTATLAAEAATNAVALREAEFALGFAQTDLDRLRAMNEGAATASVAAMERSTAAADAFDREADDWLRIAEAVGAQLTESVDDAKDSFVKRVQAYLPPGEFFGVDLQPFRVGLRSGAFIRTALSGAEWARVTLAMALVIAGDTAVGAGSLPALAMPEERAFDPNTLARVLEAWVGAPIQIVMTSPIMPTTVPTGWTVVHVGSDYAANVAPAGVAEVVQAMRTGTALDDTPPAAPKARRGRRKKSDAPSPYANDPGFCAECNSVVTVGACEHGVKAPNSASVVADGTDLF